MKDLVLDIETFSSVDLAKCGVYKYAASEDFEILLFAYSGDYGPVQVVDLASGESIPCEILDALQNPNIIKHAFNAAFERVCLSFWLAQRKILPTDQNGIPAFLGAAGWHCDMVWCAYLSLPLSLEKAGAVIKHAFNAAFERVCLSFWLAQRKILPTDQNGIPAFLGAAGWHCDMVWCAYLSLPLSLEKAGAVLKVEQQKMNPTDQNGIPAFLGAAGWHCDMVWCAYLSLPLSLEKAGAVLKVEQQKMKEGKDLIKYFCIPCKPTKTNGGRGRNLPGDDPEKWQLFKAYNKRDVETEIAIEARLSKVPVPYHIWKEYALDQHPGDDPEKWQLFKAYNKRDVETEIAIEARLSKVPVPYHIWKEYALDQQINDRGVLIDMDLVKASMKLDEQSRDGLVREMCSLTMLDNPNSVVQLKGWLAEKGYEVESLGKKEVEKMLEDAPEEIAKVLGLRLQLAKSSIKKYQAMKNYAGADGRSRGLFQFYGASRTGRASSRGVQLQNLKRNDLPDLSEARELVKSGNGAAVEMLYDSIPDTLSQLVRTALIPEPGKKFIVADFSAIEARVLSWLAGETWRMETFESGGDIYCATASKMFHCNVKFIVADFSAIEARVLSWLAGETWRMETFESGGDIYCATASKMFHCNVVKHGENGELRQKGKQAELACGYGGSVGAMKAMGALDMGLQEEELKPLVDAWRAANPKIVDFWWEVDEAIKECVRNKGEAEVEKIGFRYQSGMLFIDLPSGRSLVYVKPRIEENDFSGRSLVYVKPRIEENDFGGESITYMGVGANKKWERIESYGPKFVENIVQAIKPGLCQTQNRRERFWW